MKTFVQPGHTVTLAAPYDVAAGDGLLVGDIFGIATADAVEAAPVETRITGVVEMKKAASQAWTVGAKVYWDNTAKVATTVPTDNTPIGIALLATGDGAEETVGRVRLNGAFP